MTTLKQEARRAKLLAQLAKAEAKLAWLKAKADHEAQPAQGVRVRMSRHYPNKKGASITKIWMPRAELDRLVTIVAQAEQDGLGINRDDEIEFAVVNYDRSRAAGPGYFGLVRRGARDRRENINQPLDAIPIED